MSFWKLFYLTLITFPQGYWHEWEDNFLRVLFGLKNVLFWTKNGNKNWPFYKNRILMLFLGVFHGIFEKVLIHVLLFSSVTSQYEQKRRVKFLLKKWKQLRNFAFKDFKLLCDISSSINGEDEHFEIWVWLLSENVFAEYLSQNIKW